MAATVDEKANPGAVRSGFGLGATVVAALFIILLAQTWRKWGDMLADFGVQLYVPWKLATGAELYHDVAYLTGGPLSQYYHAWLYRIFGVSLLTIILSNLVILAWLAAAIYTGFYRNSDAWTATVAGLALLLVFAFQHCTPYGTFNYVSPYSHELVHGLALSAAVLWFLGRWLRRENIWMAFLAGLGCGFVLLTKPEVFLALALTAVVSVLLFWRTNDKPVLARALAVMVAGGILPALAFFVYFLQHESFRKSLLHVLWAWTAVLTNSAPENNLYRWCLGLDTPARHLKMILVQCLGLTAFLVFYACLFRMKLSRLAGKWVFILAIALSAYLALANDWLKCGYCLPVLCLASLGLFLWQARQTGLNQIPPLPLLWNVFSLLLLAKLGVFPRVWHYGFVLAMPAFMTAIYFLLWQLPSVLGRLGVQPEYFRATISLGLLIGFTQLWQDSQFAYGERTEMVGKAGDRMLVAKGGTHGGTTLGRVAEWIETNTPAASTLAVLPDGAMLNYLARRTNPTGYLRWNPTECALFGQDNMTRAFQRTRPDYIILIQYEVEGFKIKAFGQEASNGLALKQWIDAHYQPVYQTGPPGVVVYKRANMIGLGENP